MAWCFSLLQNKVTRHHEAVTGEVKHQDAMSCGVLCEINAVCSVSGILGGKANAGTAITTFQRNAKAL